MRNQRWMPPGVHLPQHQLDLETVAAIIRITGGNFRLDTGVVSGWPVIQDLTALRANHQRDKLVGIACHWLPKLGWVPMRSSRLSVQAVGRLPH